MDPSHDTVDEPTLTVDVTNENFEYWSSRPYLSGDLQRRISEANVLLTPFEDFRGTGDQVFPQATQQFFDYLLKNRTEEVVPEICIEDVDYKEVALHADLIIIGCVVVKFVVAPVVVGLITRYLGDRWMKGRDQATVKLELTTVREDGSASQLKYEGPYDNLETTIQAALASVGDQRREGDGSGPAMLGEK